jgi:hypothetical protein
MASEIRPLGAVLRELRTLAGQKASGFLFIVTEDNHSASIRLRGGHIEEVSFRNRHNDEAVQLLAKVSGARARFQPGPVSPSRRVPLGEGALNWLLRGNVDQQAAPTKPNRPNASEIENTDQPQIQRQVIEKIALSYFGPIATLLCEEALSGSHDIEQALHQIASNLTQRDEADQFVAEVIAALAKST